MQIKKQQQKTHLKTQQQFRKHYNKSENTMTNSKTKQQVRKHNNKSDKPEKVGTVWGSAIGLGIDDSIDNRWLDEIAVNQDVLEGWQIQWGKKVFSQPPIVQVLPLKKMREACNFHHRYTSTMRDKIRTKNPENHIVGFLKNLFENYGGK